jgi:hypothetical protein
MPPIADSIEVMCMIVMFANGIIYAPLQAAKNLYRVLTHRYRLFYTPK